MKSKVIKVSGKSFRYDFDHCIVELVIKAGKEEIAEEEEWRAKYGRPLYGIDNDGYMVIDEAGLCMDSWTHKDTRNEYLTGWAEELDEEAQQLAADFVKYELPAYQKAEVLK